MKMSSNYGQLERKVISVLTDGTALTAAEVRVAVQALGFNYSVQAIYHIFRKLRRQGVVLKVRDRFSLSMTWALDLLETARQIESKLLRSIPVAQVVPVPKQRLSWNFSSLLALDDFWVQLMLILFERSSERHMYNFCEHPWFYYAQQSKLEKFYRVLIRRQSRVHLVIGGEEYLDRAFSNSVSKSLYRCVHASGSAIGGASGLHVMAIGDFVIRVRLPKRTADGISAAFQEIQNKDLSTLLRLQSVINQPTRARLWVTQNASVAANLRRKFQILFR